MKSWTSTVAGKKRSIKIQELFLRTELTGLGEWLHLAGRGLWSEPHWRMF